VSRSVAILPNPSVLTTVGCLEKQDELAMVTNVPHRLIMMWNRRTKKFCTEVRTSTQWKIAAKAYVRQSLNASLNPELQAASSSSVSPAASLTSRHSATAASFGESHFVLVGKSGRTNKDRMATTTVMEPSMICK
jgi:hypothetical protein